MADLITLKTISDQRGSLTVIEKDLNFPIKRVFYLYGLNEEKRGGHRHKESVQGLVCLAGSCSVFINDGISKKMVHLSSPTECLILHPHEWHTMQEFSSNCILMVLASNYYDPNDYIYEPYP